MQICKQFRFEAAHRLIWHKGLCANIHGHSYMVEITLEREHLLDEMDMVTDFGNLKPIQEWIDNNRDHAYICRDDDEIGKYLEDKWMRVAYTGEMRPTAERMSGILLFKCSELFPELQIKSVVVWGNN